MSDPKDPSHAYGVWEEPGVRKVAAYARYNEHHRGLVVYDAATGRQLSQHAHKTIETLVAYERFFTPNPVEPVSVEYVGERNNPDDPVKHEVGGKEG